MKKPNLTLSDGAPVQANLFEAAAAMGVDLSAKPIRRYTGPHFLGKTIETIDDLYTELPNGEDHLHD